MVVLMSDPEAHRTGGGRADGPGDDTRYFGFQDAGSRLGGFVQVTTERATSEAVTSLCLWLPDGRTALSSQRAPATSTESAVRTGGTRVRVNDPVEDIDVVHDGRVQVLDDPWALDGPVWPTDDAQAPAGPSTDVETRLRYTFGSALYAPTRHPGRHAQLGIVAGTVQLGDFLWEVDGRGVRSRHDDGAAPALVSRWSIGAAIDDGFGFSVTDTVLADTADTCGFVWEGTMLHHVAAVRLDTVLADARGRPVELEVAVTGDRDRTWQLAGRVRRTAPVDSPPGTRALAALTEWVADDGRTGAGTTLHVRRDGGSAGGPGRGRAATRP